MDAMILAKAKLELDQEKKQREVLKAKTMAAKENRDAAIQVAKSRRENEYKAKRAGELAEVETLKKQLEDEKQLKVSKKVQ